MLSFGARCQADVQHDGDTRIRQVQRTCPTHVRERAPLRERPARRVRTARPSPDRPSRSGYARCLHLAPLLRVHICPVPVQCVPSPNLRSRIRRPASRFLVQTRVPAPMTPGPRVSSPECRATRIPSPQSPNPAWSSRASPESQSQIPSLESPRPVRVPSRIPSLQSRRIPSLESPIPRPSPHSRVATPESRIPSPELPVHTTAAARGFA